MRHILLLVAALGLIVATGPSALAQDQEREKSSSQPATPTPSESATQTTPAPLPNTYTQPDMPGQTTSTGPVMSGMVTPCGGIMPSSYVPGTVMFGSQYPQYSQYQPPYGMASPMPMMQYGQPNMTYAPQYNQQSAMPVAGSVAAGVSGTDMSGMTYQPFQSDVMLTNGMAYQPGMVMNAGGLGTYSNQPVMLSGYNGYSEPVYTTQTSGRRGLFGRRR